MVLQAAFFKLANIIPVEDAVAHMKAAVKKTYGLKGEKIVNMNLQAVDAGINALVEVKVKPELDEPHRQGSAARRRQPARR